MISLSLYNFSCTSLSVCVTEMRVAKNGSNLLSVRKPSNWPSSAWTHLHSIDLNCVQLLHKGIASNWSCTSMDFPNLYWVELRSILKGIFWGWNSVTRCMATLVEIKVFHLTHLAGVFDFSKVWSLTSCSCWQRSKSMLPFLITKSKHAWTD